MPRSKDEILDELSRIASPEQLNALYETIQAARNEEVEQLRAKPGVTEIAKRLHMVKELLMECADISALNGLRFVFTDPKGNQAHGHGWMSSACYDSDGWYRNPNATAGSVEGVPVESIIDTYERTWYSSDSNC